MFTVHRQTNWSIEKCLQTHSDELRWSVALWKLKKYFIFVEMQLSDAAACVKCSSAEPAFEIILFNYQLHQQQSYLRQTTSMRETNPRKSCDQ